MITPSNLQEKITFGNYLVAFIDILDQREILRALKTLPETDEQRKEFIQILKTSFGAVDGIRKWFKSFYSAFSATRSEKYASLSDKQKVKFDELRATEVKFQYFGDTIIMYSSLNSDLKHRAINGVYAAICASGATMLCSLAAKRPLRGAIDIGIGAEMFSGEIYGACLGNAYDLESKIAQYPRIVVGNNVVEYLQFLINRGLQKQSDFTYGYEAILAKTCLNTLAKDSDGYAFVDYLGSEFLNIVKGAGIDSELIPKASQFVQEQMKQWQETQNSKLTFRYNLLHQYFVVRLAERDSDPT